MFDSVALPHTKTMMDHRLGQWLPGRVKARRQHVICVSSALYKSQMFAGPEGLDRAHARGSQRQRRFRDNKEEAGFDTERLAAYRFQREESAIDVS